MPWGLSARVNGIDWIEAAFRQGFDQLDEHKGISAAECAARPKGLVDGLIDLTCRTAAAGLDRRAFYWAGAAHGRRSLRVSILRGSRFNLHQVVLQVVPR